MEQRLDNRPIIVWIRRDLRLTDHPALTAAASYGVPVIPIFIADDNFYQIGTAAKWRFGLGLEVFRTSLRAIASDLVLRSGPAVDVLDQLVAQTSAQAVFWQRAYLSGDVARDTEVKRHLLDRGVDARSFPGHLLFEPWSVQTKTGGFYKVFTPMWNTVRNVDVAATLPTITSLRRPESWPCSESLSDWALDDAMGAGADVVRAYVAVGEHHAARRLDLFLDEKVHSYAKDRDFPARAATSRLSENLTYGEISPRQVWHAGQRALQEGAPGAKTFLKELVWREFAYHLAWHTPEIMSRNWKPEWDDFPWQTDGPQILRWQQGRTGERFVDAAMRELYVTGTMHNRGRMIVASYLTKHLLTHWRIGQKWFEDCLIDWDPASNAMGWQWAAGSGPDAAPYFRVFNPAGQLEKFDKSNDYPSKFIAEGAAQPTKAALSFFDAAPKSWGLSPRESYPMPLISLDVGRKRALTAYSDRKSTTSRKTS